MLIQNFKNFIISFLLTLDSQLMNTVHFNHYGVWEQLLQ